MRKTFKQIVAVFIALLLPFQGIGVAPALAQTAPSMVSLSPVFTPAVLRGLKVDLQNPFHFNFVIDNGQTKLAGEELKAEGTKLIKYFLASLTLPENDLWVNLSPYEKDRIITNEFGQTEMGRQLLSEDYLLKKLSASLLHPDAVTGKKFWEQVRKVTAEKLGTTDIPMETFNRIWIMPDKAVVYQDQGTAFIGETHLKVLMEEDYKTLTETRKTGAQITSTGAQDSSAGIFRAEVLPIIEKEVNEGENFASLRQIYHSLILASWYKRTLKQSLLSQVYVDQKKVAGVESDDKAAKQKIYDQYLETFKKGVYNLIREEPDAATGELIPRKYFSGGVTLLIPKIETRPLSAATAVTTGSLSILDTNAQGFNTAANASSAVRSVVLPLKTSAGEMEIEFPDVQDHASEYAYQDKKIVYQWETGYLSSVVSKIVALEPGSAGDNKISVTNLKSSDAVRVFLVTRGSKSYIIKRSNAAFFNNYVYNDWAILKKLNPDGSRRDIANPLFVGNELLDAGHPTHENDMAYLVTGYIPGKNLSDALAMPYGPLSIPKVVDLGIELSDVVGYVHSQGIILRDINPDNIRVAEDGTIALFDTNVSILPDYDWTRDEYNFKVTAWDAWNVEDRDTIPAQRLRPDEMSDIYSVGMTLLRATVDTFYYAKRIRSGVALEDIKNLELKAIIAKALGRRETRYKNTAEIKADLVKLKESLVASSAANDDPLRQSDFGDWEDMTGFFERNSGTSPAGWWVGFDVDKASDIASDRARRKVFEKLNSAILAKFGTTEGAKVFKTNQSQLRYLLEEGYVYLPDTRSKEQLEQELESLRLDFIEKTRDPKTQASETVTFSVLHSRDIDNAALSKYGTVREEQFSDAALRTQRVVTKVLDSMLREAKGRKNAPKDEQYGNKIVFYTASSAVGLPTQAEKINNSYSHHEQEYLAMSGYYRAEKKASLREAMEAFKATDRKALNKWDPEPQFRVVIPLDQIAQQLMEAQVVSLPFEVAFSRVRGTNEWLLEMGTEKRSAARGEAFDIHLHNHPQGISLPSWGDLESFYTMYTMGLIRFGIMAADGVRFYNVRGAFENMPQGDTLRYDSRYMNDVFYRVLNEEKAKGVNEKDISIWVKFLEAVQRDGNIDIQQVNWNDLTPEHFAPQHSTLESAIENMTPNQFIRYSGYFLSKMLGEKEFGLVLNGLAQKWNEKEQLYVLKEKTDILKDNYMGDETNHKIALGFNNSHSLVVQAAVQLYINNDSKEVLRKNLLEAIDLSPQEREEPNKRIELQQLLFDLTGLGKDGSVPGNEVLVSAAEELSQRWGITPAASSAVLDVNVPVNEALSYDGRGHTLTNIAAGQVLPNVNKVGINTDVFDPANGSMIRIARPGWALSSGKIDLIVAAGKAGVSPLVRSVGKTKEGALYFEVEKFNGVSLRDHLKQQGRNTLDDKESDLLADLLILEIQNGFRIPQTFDYDNIFITADSSRAVIIDPDSIEKWTGSREDLVKVNMDLLSGIWWTRLDPNAKIRKRLGSFTASSALLTTAESQIVDKNLLDIRDAYLSKIGFGDLEKITLPQALEKIRRGDLAGQQRLRVVIPEDQLAAVLMSKELTSLPFEIHLGRVRGTNEWVVVKGQDRHVDANMNIAFDVSLHNHPSGRYLPSPGDLLDFYLHHNIGMSVFGVITTQGITFADVGGMFEKMSPGQAIGFFKKTIFDRLEAALGQANLQGVELNDPRAFPIIEKEMEKLRAEGLLNYSLIKPQDITPENFLPRTQSFSEALNLISAATLEHAMETPSFEKVLKEMQPFRGPDLTKKIAQNWSEQEQVVVLEALFDPELFSAKSFQLRNDMVSSFAVSKYPFVRALTTALLNAESDAAYENNSEYGTYFQQQSFGIPAVGKSAFMRLFNLDLPYALLAARSLSDDDVKVLGSKHLNKFLERLARSGTVQGNSFTAVARDLQSKWGLSLGTSASSAINSDKDVGGIDLTEKNMNLDLRGQAGTFTMPADPAQIQNIHIDGLVPVIMNVTPLPNLPAFLRLSEAQPAERAQLSLQK